MITMLALIPEWHFFVFFFVLGFFTGMLGARTYFLWIRSEDLRYIRGLKEDRDCRDKYIEKLGGDPLDLPYCEDDDL